MNYLSVENVAKRFGEREILKDISFGMEKENKMALVAQNGKGKSTLLKILAGIDEPDTGQVVWRKGLKTRFLLQEPKMDPDHTIWDAVFDSDDPILKAIKEYEDCLEHEILGDRFQAAMDTIEELQAWEHEVRVKSILTELKVADFDAKISSLSGGQVKRLALAKVLIDKPDFLILDEPTNHLDLEMIEWLEKFLINEKLTLLMVTHDRYFLENVCNVILELDDFGLYTYKGNYSYFMQTREERKANEQSEIEKAKNIYRTELEWMRRQPKARSTKSKARIDSFYDLKQIAKKRIENNQVELEINMERMGSKILEFHNAGKWFGDKVLFKGFNYKFVKGEKIGIIGPNGAGKSTLLNMITGSVTPDAGKVVVGDTIKIAYYSQMGMKFKPEEKVLEAVRKIADFIPLTKGKKLGAAQLLERFLFPRKMHYNQIEKLSGGERRRLFLLTILMQNPNFLILDEPTNDLDIQTLNVLEDFLLDFPGCVLIVSHDRYFMDKMVDHMFVIEGNEVIKDFPGSYTQWREWKKDNKSEVIQAAPVTEVVKKEKPKADRKERLTFNEKREFGLLEKDVERLEKRKKFINEQFETGSLETDELMELSEELGKVIEELEEKEMRWLELSEKEA